MSARYVCGDPERRARVRASERPLDGVDFVEVIDAEAEDVPGVPRQQLLAVRFLKAVPAGLAAEHATISGGVRITGVRVLWAFPLADFTDDEPAAASAAERSFLAGWRAEDAARERFWIVRTHAAGDHSPYLLTLAEPAEGDDGPRLDPRLSSVTFYFKVECAADLDCKSDRPCPEPVSPEPASSYLAKDYASFRRLMMDRLSAVTPEWTERNPADLGVALVELLAHVGDRLSYAQDAAATEAYLGTARQRISVRRHARLVDYPLGEGTNARTWVCFDVTAPLDLPGPDLDRGVPGVRLSTRFEAARGVTAQPPEALALAEAEGAVVFETLAPARLEPALGELRFYAWGDQECCLPAGATEATLLWRSDPDDPASEPLPAALVVRLPGSFLLFEEVVGPRTGAAADADPARRHVVRVTRATRRDDPLDDTPVVEVAWHPADALPFPLCISARTDGDRRLDAVSVARGNLVPADHGRTVEDEALPPVPAAWIPELDLSSDRPYRPLLAGSPVTWAAPLPAGFGADPDAPAAAFYDADPRGARAAVRLRPAGTEPEDLQQSWLPRRDLLASGRFDRHFVAEVDNRGRAVLRFGDGTHGRRPVPDLALVARYRTGNGPAGHLGAEALRHVFGVAGVAAVRNPLPTWGGAAPEALEEARRYAPEAFRVQERAVTADDYARAAERHPEVARAAATLRWTGSWATVFVTVDRLGGLPVDDDFEHRLRRHLERFRRAGHDLEVDAPRFVPLDLDLFACVAPGFLAADVRRALLEELGRFFHPDLWTFGQPLYLSHLLATVAAVPGVATAEVAGGGFRRRGRDEVPQERDAGVLGMGRLEIVRLDNDPNFPEHGVLHLELGGGR